MKKIIKTVVVISILFTLITDNLFAQGPPPWAPARGYRAKAKHIYFPEHNFYYDIQAHNYIYLNGENWSVSVAIPRPFININLGSSAQIQLDFVGHDPYIENHVHIVKYKKPKKYKKNKKHDDYDFDDDDHHKEHKKNKHKH